MLGPGRQMDRPGSQLTREFMVKDRDTNSCVKSM